MPSGGDQGEPTEDAAADPWEQLARANTAPESLSGDGRRLSLAVALLHCELRLGASFAYAPARWKTVDGGVPVRIVWAYFAALSLVRATDALDTARGIGIAFGGDEGIRSAADTAIDQAYPFLRNAANG